jgi:hypothetical protein
MLRQANVQAKLSPVNLKIELLLVAVDNTLQKPGPVFLEMARAAYKQGADYFYGSTTTPSCSIRGSSSSYRPSR